MSFEIIITKINNLMIDVESSYLDKNVKKKKNIFGALKLTS